MSSGWESAPLRGLCEFHNGLWTGKNGPFETATVIRNTNFTPNGRIDLSDVAVLQVEARHLAKRRLQKGDIIIEKSGGGPKQPVGRVALFELDAANYSFSNFTSAIRVKNPKALDPTYLHRVLYWWYVSGLTEPLQRRSTGIRNLDFDAYKDLEVPLPPLEEQKRIVAKLDQAFAALDRARTNAEANLADASQLGAVATEQLFPNDDTTVAGNPLDELCEAIVDCEHKTAPTQERGIPSIRTPNVGKGVLLLDGVNRVSEETYREWTRRAEPRPGDLILAREAPAGNVAVIPEEMRVCLGQRTVLLRPKNELFIPAYLAHLLLRPSSQARLLAHSRGATVQHINVKDIRAFRISSLPSLSAQRAVVRGVEGLMAQEQSLIDSYSRKLADIAALRQSLLRAAFSGQLS